MRTCGYQNRASTEHFFFSSRSRHTRSLCDWSSDVCSSDLFGIIGVGMQGSGLLRTAIRLPGVERSEERRVGKECRSRWGPQPARTRQEVWSAAKDLNGYQWRGREQTELTGRGLVGDRQQQR